MNTLLPNWIYSIEYLKKQNLPNDFDDSNLVKSSFSLDR